MKIDTFANRLRKAMEINNYRQVDLVNISNINKTLINKYLNGVSEAKNDNLEILASVLNVSEIWLLGYDVPIRETNNNKNDIIEEYQNLFDKDNALTVDQKKFFMDFIKERHRNLDDLKEKIN